MECQDALDLLHEIIDKEASEIDTAQVKQHLENCRECFKKFEIEESVQEFLDEKLKETKQETASTDKLESLRLRITSQLDEIDVESECQHSSKSKGIFGISGRTVVAAASLVLLIAAAYVSAGLIRHFQTYAPIEDAHHNAVANSQSFNNQQVTSNIMNVLASDFNYTPATELKGYRLIGGKIEEIMGVEMNHLVYSNENNDAVSLFVVSSDKFEIPQKLEDSKQVFGDSYFYKHHCDGCNLVYFKGGSLIFITAATNNSLELAEFIAPNVI